MNKTTILQFDMRSSPECPDAMNDRYKACVDMAVWADSHSIDVVGFSEHHNTQDGFLSSPLMMAMAVAYSTQKIRISVSALLLPLHDPIRVAEDIAMLDLISNGRFVTTLGLGYRETEYQVMGVDWKKRGKVFDEKIAILLKAWSGDAFDYNGTTMQLNPAPNTPARSMIFVGGNSPAAARRAARFNLMFAPPLDDLKLQNVYKEECNKQEFKHGFIISPNEPNLTLIAEDPDKAWHDVGKYFLYDALAYSQWQHKTRRAYAESNAKTLSALRAEGKYQILSPQQAAHVLNTKGALNLAPLCGGMPIDHAWVSLHLYNEQVVPLLTGSVL